METEIKTQRKINPSKKANFFSKLLFFYMLPIFRKNYKEGLKESELYATLDEQKSKTLGDRLEDIWTQQHRKHKKWALHRSLFKIFGFPYIVNGILQLILEVIYIMVVPFGVGGLVSYFDSASKVTESEAYMYASLMIMSLLIDTVLSNHTAMFMDRISMQIRVSCCSLIYRKALRLSRTALIQTTIGQIVNLLSNDVSKFDQGLRLCHFVWIAPVQATLGTYLLYRIVGVSAFSGIAFLLLFIPLQMFFGKRTATLRLRTALRTDERVRLMNEILNGIQVIKMYTWEKPFAKLISLARKYEIQSIRANFFLEAITFTLESVLTKTALFITIIVYVSLGNDIDAKTVYSVMAVYDALQPIMTFKFAYGISSVAEVHVTMGRIQTFMSYEELPQEQLDSSEIKENGLETSTENGSTSRTTMKNLNVTPRVVSETQIAWRFPGICLKDVSAQWESNSSECTLEDINININKPQLIAVIGQVGSGKSSLFNVILKELPISKGSLTVDGIISYAAQETWLFSASVRQNILFAEEYVEDRYKTVLKICALESDLSVLPHGDRTIVGEKGKVLSGGQKARINLARCIYKPADIYLLDDPLSAVDTKVGKQLYEECISNFLSDKICILITHQLQYLKSADKIIILKEGKILGEGSYDELQTSGLDFAKLLEEFNSEPEEETDNKKKLLTSRQHSEMSSHTEEDEEDLEDAKETLESGSISANVYGNYLRAGGNYFMIILLAFLFIATQVAHGGSEYYISEWVNLEQKLIDDKEHNITNNETDTPDREVMMYGYSGIIAAIIVLATFQGIYTFVFFMRASVNMHDFIFAKISCATMRFFNSNPTGRILNRFSKDLGVIDEYIPYIVYDVVQIFLSFCTAAVLTSIVNPWLLIPAAGIAAFFYLLRNIYLETSRSVKRIEGITRSPIFTHMTASMHGLSTIRAFHAQERLSNEFDDHQDLHSSAWFLYISSNRAFAFYLQFICLVIVSVVAVSLVLIKRDYYGGEAGLILTQYISITSILEWGIRGWSELENNMTSVERTLEYTRVKTEPVREPLSLLSRNWPEFGKIVFQNVSMKYNPEEASVLKDLSFTINPKEKVGVVGRTGAGKSSMIAALFQLYDIEGSIVIDNIDTTQLPLEILRSKISIIPQDPVLFSGTVRRNLDPFDEYNDEVLWDALEQVELKEVVGEMSAGLSGNVTESGSNFSVGQRQLICLARAIIRNNKILVMDEATANVDPQTDVLIQRTIRKKFDDCTVITIAHRLHTIMDSDRVLVVDAGKLVEFDHPRSLLQDTNGMFCTMVQTTGITVAKNLSNIAEENFTKSKNS